MRILAFPPPIFRDGRQKNIFGQANNKDNRKTFCTGIEYTLPLFIKLDLRLDTEGKTRLQFRREDLHVLKRLRFSFMLNTDKEYLAGIKYIVTKYFSLSSHYDSDLGLGTGITITY